RVAFGRVDAAVTEQLLHVADIGTGAQKMRRERVPQRVRRHVSFDSCCACCIFHGSEDRASAETSSRSPTDEKECAYRSACGEEWTRVREVLFECVDGRRADRHDALLC